MLLAGALLVACPDDDGSPALDQTTGDALADKSTLPDLFVPPDQPPLDREQPDLLQPDLPCTCIPVSAWTGWKWRYCDCFDFKWGCQERPTRFGWCDVYLDCLYEDTDPATGCPRPNVKFTGCGSCWASDLPPPDLSLDQ